MVKKNKGVWLLAFCTLVWAALSVMVGGFVAGFLFWIGLGLLAYEWLVAAVCFAGVSFSRELSAGRLTAGDDLTVKIRVRRRYGFPLYWFVLKDRGDLEESASGGRAEFLLSGSDDVLEYRVYHLRRGRYAFRGVEFTAGDLFGFVTRTRFVRDERTLIVYPRLFPIDVLPEGWTRQGSDHRRHATRPDPSVVSGIRNYEQGDRLQRIHWKASSRGQGLKVKEFDREAAEEYLLMLDQREQAYRGRAEEVFEQAVSVTASLAREWMERKIPVSVLLTGRTPVRLAPVTSEDHFIRLLEYLVDVQPDGTRPLDPHAAFGNRGWPRQLQVVLVTPLEDESVRVFARELKRLRIQFTCVSVLDQTKTAFGKSSLRPIPSGAVRA